MSGSSSVLGRGGGGVTSFKLKVFVSYSSINLLVKHIKSNFTGVSRARSRCAAPLCVCLRRVVWSLHAPFGGPCGTDPRWTPSPFHLWPPCCVSWTCSVRAMCRSRGSFWKNLFNLALLQRFQMFLFSESCHGLARELLVRTWPRCCVDSCGTLSPRGVSRLVLTAGLVWPHVKQNTLMLLIILLIENTCISYQ